MTLGVKLWLVTVCEAEMDKRKKIAIIGASTGQYPICAKAVELGYETHCFAWEKGAVCKDVVDYFHPISITEMDKIVEVCRKNNIDGVVSNASETTATVVSYVAEKLGLLGTPYEVMQRLHDKYYVRSLTSNVKGLCPPVVYKYNGTDEGLYPCVVKPIAGQAKIGVSYVKNAEEFSTAIKYSQEALASEIIVEEYIKGKELSVESISYKGKHYVVQITDKDSSSAPHFVELGHHQPALISSALRAKIETIIPEILTRIGYTNGASHIELKYNGDNLYLVEANLRGGGDNISNKLVEMSSGIDYLRSMIEVAVGDFKGLVKVSEPAFAGIYYLCEQTEGLIPFFQKAKGKEWFVEGEFKSHNLHKSYSNYERDGYLIYKSTRKITPKD